MKASHFRVITYKVIVCGDSMKFGSKLMYLDYLHQLAQHLQLDQLIIPPAVRKLVSSSLSICAQVSRLSSKFLTGL